MDKSKLYTEKHLKALALALALSLLSFVTLTLDKSQCLRALAKLAYNSMLQFDHIKFISTFSSHIAIRYCFAF